MIPNFKINVLFLVIMITVFSCKKKKQESNLPLTNAPEEVLSDSLFGDLTEKQQYYQHLILEVPESFQTNIDSLLNWITENEPGALRFLNWDIDSVSRLRVGLDSLDIIQPFYYVNYFSYLNLPNYPYWDVSKGNSDSIWTKAFSNDKVGMIEFSEGKNNSKEFDDWLLNWKEKTGITFWTHAYEDSNVKRDFQHFIGTLKGSQNGVKLDLAKFDTVRLDRYRKVHNYKGLFAVNVAYNSVNAQMEGGLISFV